MTLKELLYLKECINKPLFSDEREKCNKLIDDEIVKLKKAETEPRKRGFIDWSKEMEKLKKR